MDILSFEDETIPMCRIILHQLSSDAASHSRRTETTALVRNPKACNTLEVKYFCTCVANHSFRVLCFYVNVTCILETDTAARFMAGNWKCKSEVVHGVLQFESICLVL
jgi:hypothetical protein